MERSSPFQYPEWKWRDPMQEDRKPTIYIKTASSACPDIVGDWAMGQKNPNESVKYLIIQLAAHFGNEDIFDPAMINTLNLMLSRKESERRQLSGLEENYDKKVETIPLLASEKDKKTKKTVEIQHQTEPVGSKKDIVELKFMDNVNSPSSQSEAEKVPGPNIADVTSKTATEKAEPVQTGEIEGAAETTGNEKNIKKKVGRRPRTASNIMQ